MGSALVRAYPPARRTLARAMRLVQTVFDGFWLGLLSPEEQALVDERFYRRLGTAAGTDATFEGSAHNLSGLHEWERRVVDERFRPGCGVVVTSAGGGREVIALAELGYRVAGYEPNPALAAAGQRLLSGRASVQDASVETSVRDAFPQAAGPCHAVVIGWGSYIHVRGRRRRVALLGGARASLEAGDPLLVSFWERPHGDGYFGRVQTVAATVCRLRGLEAPEIGDTMRDSYVHWFSRAEVEAELAEAGFSMAEYRSQPYAHAVGIAT